MFKKINTQFSEFKTQVDGLKSVFCVDNCRDIKKQLTDLDNTFKTNIIPKIEKFNQSAEESDPNKQIYGPETIKKIKILYEEYKSYLDDYDKFLLLVNDTVNKEIEKEELKQKQLILQKEKEEEEERIRQEIEKKKQESIQRELDLQKEKEFEEKKKQEEEKKRQYEEDQKRKENDSKKIKLIEQNSITSIDIQDAHQKAIELMKNTRNQNNINQNNINQNTLKNRNNSNDYDSLMDSDDNMNNNMNNNINNNIDNNMNMNEISIEQQQRQELKNSILEEDIKHKQEQQLKQEEQERLVKEKLDQFMKTKKSQEEKTKEEKIKEKINQFKQQKEMLLKESSNTENTTISNNNNNNNSLSSFSSNKPIIHDTIVNNNNNMNNNSNNNDENSSNIDENDEELKAILELSKNEYYENNNDNLLNIQKSSSSNTQIPLESPEMIQEEYSIKSILADIDGLKQYKFDTNIVKIETQTDYNNVYELLKPLQYQVLLTYLTSYPILILWYSPYSTFYTSTLKLISSLSQSKPQLMIVLIDICKLSTLAFEQNIKLSPLLIYYDTTQQLIQSIDYTQQKYTDILTNGFEFTSKGDNNNLKSNSLPYVVSDAELLATLQNHLHSISIDTTQDHTAITTCFSKLKTILSNIVKDPTNNKYRKINMNASGLKKVIMFSPAVSILILLHFEEKEINSVNYIMLSYEQTNTVLLTKAIHLIENEQNEFEKASSNEIDENVSYNFDMSLLPEDLQTVLLDDPSMIAFINLILSPTVMPLFLRMQTLDKSEAMSILSDPEYRPLLGNPLFIQGITKVANNPKYQEILNILLQSYLML